MKEILLIMLICVFSFSFGQNRKERKSIAKNQIVNLKGGTLLVRLSSKKQIIELLKEKGYPKKAAYYKKQQEETNKEIIKAFNQYKFGKKLFFYSHFSDSIKKGKLNSVTFFNDSLEQVSLTLDTNGFFIAAIGDLPKNYDYEISDSVAVKNKKKGLSTKKDYQGGSNLSVKSLYIMDKNLTVLEKPFPFYQRYHPMILTTLTTEEVVEKLNEKLVEFYEK